MIVFCLFNFFSFLAYLMGLLAFNTLTFFGCNFLFVLDIPFMGIFFFGKFSFRNLRGTGKRGV